LDRAEYLLAFAQYYPYGPPYFIFGGFFQVSAVVPEVTGGPGYKLTLLAQHSEYIKRLIIKLERPVGRDLYLRWYETLQGSRLNPEVYELAPDTKLGTFPGYQNVRLRHHELQRIIANDEPISPASVTEPTRTERTADCQSLLSARARGGNLMLDNSEHNSPATQFLRRTT